MDDADLIALIDLECEAGPITFQSVVKAVRVEMGWAPLNEVIPVACRALKLYNSDKTLALLSKWTTAKSIPYEQVKLTGPGTQRQKGR